MVDIQGIHRKILDYLIFYGPKLIAALVVLAVGFFLIRFVRKLLQRRFRKSKMDESLQGFLLDIIGALLKVLLIITFLSMLGIQMTSFVAILGAASLAVGLALQGNLANLGGGVLLILQKPFKIGDYIDAQGYAGTVSIIHIFHTILKTPDNKTVIIPNGALANGTIINYSTENLRRVDLRIGISYDADIQKARGIIQRLVQNDARILQSPEAFVGLENLGDSAVELVIRVWTIGADYWAVHFELLETVKEAFDREHISIPYPQRDIHIIEQAKK